HDYGRFPCNFKGKIAQDVAPCVAREYNCRSIAKGLTARIAGLLSKTCQEVPDIVRLYTGVESNLTVAVFLESVRGRAQSQVSLSGVPLALRIEENAT
ncbi:MAG TPA: hypothetical protein VFB30_17085, partial [Spirochaetia bacterium]|nr:hypothetical protein [Spirochaetia bacterium]